MLEKDAVYIIKKHMPMGKIQKICSYKNLYLAIVFTTDPYEGEMDAIYYVNKETDEFGVFPYLEETVFGEVMELLEKTPKLRR